MGFVLTLIYLLSIHMALPETFPALAPLRPQLTIAVLTTLASLPVLLRWQRPFEWRQLTLLLLFVSLVVLSWLPRGYLGGVAMTAQDFLPDVAVFFFVVLHVNTPRRLKILCGVLIAGAILTVSAGIVQYHTAEAPDEDDEDAELSYVMIQRIGSDAAGEQSLVLQRLRGLGVLNDPNDYSQYLLVLMPFVLLLWDARRKWMMISLTAAGLLFSYGIYLSRSRGALVGLLFLIGMMLQGSLRIIGAIAGGLLLVAVRYGADFTGGRSISVEAGSDRLQLWADGVEMIKSSPLWGVGYRAYVDETGGLTAHNSYMLCAAEAGLPAYFLWIALLVVTVLQMRAIGADNGPWAADEETRRWSRGLLMSLYLFLVTAFFLSRTFSPTLYMLLGMCGAMAAMEARRRNRDPFPHKTWWPAWAGASGTAILALIYGLVKLQ